MPNDCITTDDVSFVRGDGRVTDEVATAREAAPPLLSDTAWSRIPNKGRMTVCVSVRDADGSVCYAATLTLSGTSHRTA